MEIINSRFKIISNIDVSPENSEYLVMDLMKNSKMSMSIIEEENLSERVLLFLENKFVELTNLEHVNLERLESFGRINNIDNKDYKNGPFFIVKSVSLEHIPLSSFKIESEKDIADIIIGLCHALIYLHSRGYYYKILDENNILCRRVNDKISVKLKDLASIEIARSVKSDYKAGFLRDDGFIEKRISNILSVGTLMTKLYARLNNTVNPYDNDYFVDIDEKVSPDVRIVIKKILDRQFLETHQLINEVIKLYSLSAPVLLKEYHEKLNLRTGLVGREIEYSALKESNRLMRESNKKCITVVKGNEGIGKTRLVKELEFHVSLKGNSTIYVNEETSLEKSFSGIKPVIKKMLLNAKESIVLKYGSELSKVIPEICDEYPITPSSPLNHTAEKFRLLNRITGFVSEWSNENNPTIIIDNIQYMDTESLELLESMLADKENMLAHFVLTHNDKESSNNESVIKLLQSIEHNSTTITLGNLSVDETARMIGQIIGMAIVPIRFGTLCFKETEGNPRFNGEMVKALLNQNLIKLDVNTGYWISDTSDYDVIPIPENLDKALLAQLSTFDDRTKEVLQIVSVFNQSISIKVISRMTKISEIALLEIVSSLVRNQLIQERIEDWGYTYVIENRKNRSTIYSSIPKAQQNDMHEMAAKVLEELLVEEYRENTEELVYHLILSGQDIKAASYTKESALKFEGRFMYPQALSAYEKALELYKKLNNLKETKALLIRIGATLMKLGRIDEAYDIYTSAKDSEGKLDTEEYVDIIIRLAEARYRKLEMDQADALFNEALCISTSIGYLEGKYRVLVGLARILVFYGKNKEAIDFIEEHLPEAITNKLYDYLGDLYNIIGISHVNLGKCPEGLNYYEQSMDNYDKAGQFAKKAKPLNNTGVVYGDHYCNAEKEYDAFNKMLSIAEKYNDFDLMATATINLSETFISAGNFDEALRMALKSLNICKDYGIFQTLLIIYNNLSSIYISIGDYEKANKYLSLSKAEIENSSYDRVEVKAYYYEMARFYYFLGNDKLFERYLEKAKNITNETELRLFLRVKYLDVFYRTRRGDKITKESVDDLFNEKHYDSERMSIALEILFNMSIRYNSSKEAKYLLSRISSYTDTTATQLIKLNFCKGLMSVDMMEKEMFLRAVIDDSSKNSELHLAMLGSVKIAELYQSQGKTDSAIYHYINSLDYFNKTILSVPCDEIPEYMKLNDMLSVKQKLIELHGNSISDDSFDFVKPSSVSEDYKTFFEDERLSRIIKDSNVIEYSFKNRKRITNYDFSNHLTVLKDLSGDYKKDIKLMLSYLVDLTFADRGYVFIQNDNHSYDIFEDFVRQDVKYSENPAINDFSEPIFESRTFDCSPDKQDLAFKGKIIIPMSRDNNYSKPEGDRRKTQKESQIIQGYLYLDTSKILNNFTQSNFEVCRDFAVLFSTLLENYKLKEVSTIDKLTGTLTRKHFESVLKTEIANAKSGSKHISLIMYDIDFFKKVNDNYGHQKGDEILASVSEIVKKNIRISDYVGRYGGEEFVVILPSTTKLEAEVVSEKIRKSIEDARLLGTDRSLTVSLGISSYPDDGVIFDELILKADQALYHAKETGRNKSCSWTKTIGKVVKSVDKLAGIITGNQVQDQRNVLVITELIELVSEDLDEKEKIYRVLGRIIETIEAHRGYFIKVNNETISEIFGRERINTKWIDDKNLSFRSVNSVINKKTGDFFIDWDDVNAIDSVTGNPRWQSILITPILKKGEVKGILYLSAPLKEKEFDFNSFNFVSVLSNIISANF